MTPPVLALVCRGCCCGTSKHPGVDHDAHLAAIADSADAIEVTDCLGPCRWSNVVVAIDETGTQTWFGKVLLHADLTALTTWLADPHAPRPDHLVRHPTRPDRERVAQLRILRRARSRAQHPSNAFDTGRIR